MVTVQFDSAFEKTIRKIKDETLKLRVKKQIQKIIENPNIGKPMRFGRKGTRELYVPPFRLAYAHIPSEDAIIFLELYHKDEQ